MGAESFALKRRCWLDKAFPTCGGGRVKDNEAGNRSPPFISIAGWTSHGGVGGAIQKQYGFSTSGQCFLFLFSVSVSFSLLFDTSPSPLPLFAIIVEDPSEVVQFTGVLPPDGHGKSMRSLTPGSVTAVYERIAGLIRKA